MSEWKAIAAISAVYLGMPVDASPLYSSDIKWSRKAQRILSFVLETGNFGYYRDKSYYGRCPVVVYKAISLWNNTRDSLRHLMIFPKDAFRVWVMRLRKGGRWWRWGGEGAIGAFMVKGIRLGMIQLSLQEKGINTSNAC